MKLEKRVVSRLLSASFAATLGLYMSGCSVLGTWTREDTKDTWNGIRRTFIGSEHSLTNRPGNYTFYEKDRRYLSDNPEYQNLE